MSTIFNFCRLCAEKKISTDFIDETSSNENILQRIFSLFQIENSIGELSLPKLICQDCCNKANYCLEFCNLIRKAQNILYESVLVKNERILENPDNSRQSFACDSHIENNGCMLQHDNDNLKEEKISSNSPAENVNGRKECYSFPSMNNVIDCNVRQQTTDLKIRIRKEKSRKIFKIVEKRCKTILTASNKTSQLSEKTDKDRRQSDFSLKVWKNYQLKCNDCTEEISSLSHLRKHYTDVHKKPAVYACSECFKVYQRYKSFYRHISKHYKKHTVYRCEVCGKSTITKEFYEQHIATHADGEQPPTCKDCGKVFKSVRNLQIHARVHLPEESKPKFTCDTCSKSFLSIYSLRDHIKIHTGEKTFCCEQCGQAFRTKQSAISHNIQAHGGERKFHCEQCSRSFIKLAVLKKHIKIVHENIRPFKCDVCSKSFSNPSNLKDHMTIHSSVYAFICTLCQKRFKRSAFLKIHMRQHTGEKPYSCSECHNYQFTSSGNYFKHMKRKHGYVVNKKT